MHIKTLRHTALCYINNADIKLDIVFIRNVVYNKNCGTQSCNADFLNQRKK